ncbi:hypothetical protein EVAR_21057_1 [Eumeta japonica]|uniref:Uncharacterized protein n=1 Tax=Eumeta variegata TaxID=151549 RepID=A0A4C1V1R5_EUMVA|nr:hypothetical protein EVAR_21057_1 [Eumeta japonica]
MHEVRACKSRERPASAARKFYEYKRRFPEQDAIRHQAVETTKYSLIWSWTQPCALCDRCSSGLEDIILYAIRTNVVDCKEPHVADMVLYFLGCYLNCEVTHVRHATATARAPQSGKKITSTPIAPHSCSFERKTIAVTLSAVHP